MNYTFWCFFRFRELIFFFLIKIVGLFWKKSLNPWANLKNTADYQDFIFWFTFIKKCTCCSVGCGKTIL